MRCARCAELNKITYLSLFSWIARFGRLLDELRPRELVVAVRVDHLELGADLAERGAAEEGAAPLLAVDEAVAVRVLFARERGTQRAVYASNEQ